MNEILIYYFLLSIEYQPGVELICTVVDRAEEHANGENHICKLIIIINKIFIKTKVLFRCMSFICNPKQYLTSTNQLISYDFSTE